MQPQIDKASERSVREAPRHACRLVIDKSSPSLGCGSSTQASFDETLLDQILLTESRR